MFVSRAISNPHRKYITIYFYYKYKYTLNIFFSRDKEKHIKVFCFFNLYATIKYDTLSKYFEFYRITKFLQQPKD